MFAGPANLIIACPADPRVAYPPPKGCRLHTGLAGSLWIRS